MGEKLLSERLSDHHEFSECFGFDELRDMARELEAKVADSEVVRCHHGWRGAAAPSIDAPCPACGQRCVFVGEGGYLTCSILECPEPDAPHTALVAARETVELRKGAPDGK